MAEMIHELRTPPEGFERSEGGIYIMRHGPKYKKLDCGKSDEVRGCAGSVNDKRRIHITPEGKERLKTQGTLLFADREYSRVIAAISDFVRADESARYLLEGSPRLAALLKENRIPISHSMTLGQGITPFDWKHPDCLKLVNPWTETGEDGKMIIRNWWNHFYFPSTDATRPNQAVFSHGQVEGLLNIVDDMVANRNDGPQQLGLIVTHAPNVNTWTNLVYGYATPDREKGRLEWNEDKFSGPVTMGEIYAVTVNNMKRSDPDLEFHVRDRTIGMKKSQLERRKDQFMEDAMKIIEYQSAA